MDMRKQETMVRNPMEASFMKIEKSDSSVVDDRNEGVAEKDNNRHQSQLNHERNAVESKKSNNADHTQVLDEDGENETIAQTEHGIRNGSQESSQSQDADVDEDDDGYVVFLRNDEELNDLRNRFADYTLFLRL